MMVATLTRVLLDAAGTAARGAEDALARSATGRAADPVPPSPDEAHRWAQEELSKPAYGRSAVERFLDWLADRLTALFQPSGAPGTLPVPNLLAVLLILVLVALIVWLVVQARRRSPAPPPDEAAEEAVFGERPLAAAEYRRRALAALQVGEAATAVVDGFRAIAAQSLERHALDEARDQTAQEFAAALRAVFPAFGDRVEQAAGAFDEALYGALPATPQQARRVLDLDEELTRATPRRLDAADLPTPLAVP